jgi:hypothetical protein
MATLVLVVNHCNFSLTMMMITQCGADFKYDTIFPHDQATGDSWASVLL